MLEPEGGAVLGENTTWIELEILMLNSNHLGQQGVLPIATNSTWENLKIRK
mgnify:CR=1 FL=1